MNKLELEFPIVFDGAMGTYYRSKGKLDLPACEMANIFDKETILSIHKEYIEAGAHALKTNTFGANRWKNPSVAAEKAAKDLGRAYGVKMTEKTPFKLKGTNRAITVQEIAQTMADKQIETNIQDFIIQNFEPAIKTKNQNVDGIKLYAYNWDKVDMANIGFKVKDSWLYHTKTHAEEFNLGRHDNEKYLAIIREMAQKKPFKDVTIYTNGNARIIYEESTNTFVKLVGGGVRTMFKPRRKLNYVRDEIAEYKSNFEPEPREAR